MDRFLTHVVKFVNGLHGAGLKVSPAELIDLCSALRIVDVGDRAEFRAAATATLVRSRDDMDRFDELFRQYWEGELVAGAMEEQPGDSPDLSPEPGARMGTAGRDLVTPADPGDDNTAEPGEPGQPGYSPEETLLHKDIGTMTPAELEQARQLVAELVRTLINYRSRRFTPGKSGRQPDFRRILRRSAPYGEYATRLLFRRRREKKVRLVLLCDVSGSMQTYSKFLIQFIYALRHEVPQVEVGVFSTRMTMISDLLGGRDIHASMQRLESRVADWGSGTDIGGCLREFNRQFSRQVLRARTLLVILSDGWDRGDAQLMQEQIAWLSRRVHKLIWLNPLLGHSGYAPLCRGIRTALPYMDHFLPAHNLMSLKQLARTLRAEWT